MILSSRRRFIAGLFCAPAIIQIDGLMRLSPAPRIIDYQAMLDQMMKPYLDGYVQLWKSTILYGSGTFEHNGIKIDMARDGFGDVVYTRFSAAHLTAGPPERITDFVAEVAQG